MSTGSLNCLGLVNSLGLGRRLVVADSTKREDKKKRTHKTRMTADPGKIIENIFIKAFCPVSFSCSILFIHSNNLFLKKTKFLCLMQIFNSVTPQK